MLKHKRLKKTRSTKQFSRNSTFKQKKNYLK